MFEIAPSSRPPLATLLAVALPLLAIAAWLLRRAARSDRLRMLVGALSLAALLTSGSTVLRSRRHAGTGTETARGWPRIVRARWVSFEDGAERTGLQWRGIAEGGLLYAAIGAGLLALRHARRRRAR